MGTLEVLVALSLFAFILIAIIGLLIGSISTGATAEASSIASNLARQRLEEMAAVATQTGSLVAPADEQIRVPAGGRPYTVATTLGDLGNNITDISVRVSYQISYGSACAGDAAGGASCRGNVRTYERTLQTRVRRP